MTDTEAIALRADRATPGPWQPYIAYSGESGTPDEVGIYAGAGTTHHGQENTVISDWTLYGSEMLPDLEFMAAARTDIPELLARVRELEAEVRTVRAAHHDVGVVHEHCGTAEVAYHWGRSCVVCLRLDKP